MKELRGRVAVITGGAAGIGRATALALAREGMHIVLADLDEAGLARVCDEVKASGQKAWGVRTDVSQENDVRRLYEHCLSLAGGVHVVMNNAGIARFGPALELSDDDWKRVIDVNLWGVIHGCRIFGPHLVAQRAGHILNTASVAGLAGLPTAASYVTAKFGVVGLSEVLRFELAPSCVGVTAICPGFTKTSIANVEGSEELAKVVQKYGGDPDALAKRIVRAIRRDESHVLFGPEPLIMTTLRRVSTRLYDRTGRALGKAMLKDATRQRH
jgi:NAD(P)-dependent dehydrogenase (short-subunit alcohol dehydrogenase family)